MPLGAHKAAIMGVAGTTVTGDVVLLSTQTASNSTEISFTSGITSTSGEYIFKFYNINPATDNVDFTFQANATDITSYDTAMTTSAFLAHHNEDNSAAAITYTANEDQAQGTSYQPLAYEIGNGADESCAGTLHLFNPSSTTYAKHFYSRVSNYGQEDRSNDIYIAGYFNDTTAIDDIQFKMTSGNFDGKIKMWGVK